MLNSYRLLDFQNEKGNLYYINKLIIHSNVHKHSNHYEYYHRVVYFTW